MARATRLDVAGEQDEAPGGPEPPPSGRSRRLPPVAILLVGLLLVAVLVAAWRLSQSGPGPLTRTDVDRAVQAGIDKSEEDQRNAPPDAATAYRRIIPSLVTVTATEP